VFLLASPHRLPHLGEKGGVSIWSQLVWLLVAPDGLPVGRRRRDYGLFEEAVEEQPAAMGAAAVEAECELA